MKEYFVASLRCVRRSTLSCAVQFGVFGLLLLAASRAQAVEIFIKFTPAVGAPAIVGESSDVVYPGNQGWFEVKDFSFSVVNSNSIGSASGGAGAGRAAFKEANLNKVLNVNSPALFRALTTGSHYDTVQMVVRKPTSPQNQASLIFDFKLAFVTSQTFAGAQGDDFVSEKLGIIYGAIRITHRPLNSTGTGYGTSVIGQWNQVNNSENIDSF